MHLVLVLILKVTKYYTVCIFDKYCPRLREGNVFILSVCVSVWAITFKFLTIETSFLVCWYILTISRSSLSTKAIGSR